MIGQPLQKINRIPNATDYNKLVDIVRPYQNLQIGTGLNGMIAPNGISISVGRTPGAAPFDFPFKVEATSLSAADIQFGRVFEERNFQGVETSASETSLRFIELSATNTFSVSAGMTLDLNPTINADSILIAVNDNFETSLTDSTYTICLSSDIESGYHPAHIVANLTKAASATEWNVEQVLMGDYTFDRNPPVPFDITRYGDKWLIYLPVGSLIINAEDWTQKIDGLTNGISPIVGDWYEFNKDYNYINVNPTGTTAWGKVNTVSYDATPNQIKAHSWKISDGVKPLIHGTIYYEFIRPDAGDSNSTSRSIAVQGQTFGITEEPGVYSDYTLELHGFFNSLAPEGDPNDPDQTSYIYKIPVREYDVANESASLRWVPYDSLSGGGSLSGFDFPWKATVNPDTQNIDIIIGRVYEYQSFEDSSSSDMQYAIDELAGITYNPTDIASITVTTADYISIYRDYTYPNKWEIGLESNPPSQGILLQKICRVYASGETILVEQIHMGDINFNEPTLHAFSVARLNGDTVMYIPAKSLVINGQDYTGNATGNSGDSIQATAITDWYRLLYGNFYSIYIRLNNDSSSYGTVGQTYIRTEEVAANGESIVIPLYDPNLRRNYQTGSVYKEFIRTDAHTTQYTGMRQSLDESVTDGAASGDRTMQITNFKYADVNTDPLDGTGDTYEYTFLVREYDQANDNAEMKYAPWSAMETSIDNTVNNYIENNFNEYLTEYWWDWYYGLSGIPELSGSGFWQQGAGSDINFGISIGSSPGTTVIDLTGQTLAAGAGTWYAACDFFPTTDVAYNLGCSDRRWNQGRFNEIYTESIGSGTNSVMNIRNDVTSSGCSLGLQGYAFGCAHINTITTSELIPGPNSGILFNGDVAGNNGCSLGLPNQGFGALYLGGSGIIYNQGIPIIGQQQAAIADTTDTTDVATQFNLLLAALRTHGLIAT